MKSVLADPSFIQSLQNKLAGRIVIVGVGNRLKSDDGVGSLIAEHINGKITARVIDVGTGFENHMGMIIRENPDSVVIIVAVERNEKPGTMHIVEMSDLFTLNVSTHGLSFSLAAKYLIDFGVKHVFIIGIQSKTVAFGDTLSRPVAEAMHSLISVLIRIVNKKEDGRKRVKC